MSDLHPKPASEVFDREPVPRKPLRRTDMPDMPRRQRVSQSAAEGEGTFKLKPIFFWWTFCQWWKVILPAGLLLAGIAATCIILTYKPSYRASALIMVEDSVPYIAYSGAGASGNTKKYVQTQIELLRSSVVLGPVLARPEIAQLEELKKGADSLERLQKGLGISRVGGSELYNVSYKSKSPQAAADVANAVVAEYLAIQSDEEFRRTQRVIDLLEEERRRRSLDVERLRQRVVELAKDVTGRDPFAQNSILDMSRANNDSTTLYQELAQLDVKRELLQAELSASQESSISLPDHHEKSGLLHLEVTTALANHPAVLENENVIAQLQSKMTWIEANKVKKQNDPEWKRLEKKVQQLEAALTETKDSLREGILLRRTELHKLASQEQTGKIQWQLDQLNTQREILTRKFDDSLSQLKKSGGKSVELEFARAELVREESVFEMIASRKLAMQTELRAPTRVRLRQQATKPKRPVAPLPYKNLFVACMASLVAPFGLSVLREISVKRISEVEQLSRQTHMRILGEISHFPIKQVAVRLHGMSARLRRQMFLYNESIDSIRTSLSLSEDMQKQQLLVVTSAAAGEGKTSVATSLAMSIGNASRTPTLVIDADMRSPDVSTVLASRNGPGLVELLSKKAELKDVIQRVGETNTYVIPAGRLKGNPHHLLQSGQFERMVVYLRDKFPTIIIDTPPVFGGSEALVFAKQADGVIISTLCDVSREKQVRSAVEKLEHAGANIFGAVLNGKSASSYAYSYGYGYYSGRTDMIES